MKTALRLFVLSLVVASAAAATIAPASYSSLISHQAASASVPAPSCGPYMPGCNMK